VLDHFAAAIPDFHKAREKGMFPDHFLAMADDVAGAERERRAAREYAFPALILGLGGLGFWYNMTDGIQPMGANLATFILAASVFMLTVSSGLWLAAHFARRSR